jgi:BirA family biotin operon repressor/biotin-[acetyl-CoA-carboxylase] ligase
LPSDFLFLRKAVIQAGLSTPSVEALKNLTVLDEVGSTNAWLLQLARDEFHAHAVFAEQQTAGRGRRGRAWQSPAGCNIYLSLGWIFNSAVRDLSCLSLVVGVAVVRALESQGIEGAGLKWPNDIQADGKKVGGILLESRPAGGGRAAVVMGIGLNVAMPPDDSAAQGIDQPWTSVAELPGASPDAGLRDRLAGALLDQLLQCLPVFGEAGFRPFQADWQRLDVLLHRAVTVSSAEGEINGVSMGIDQQGSLLVSEQLPSAEQQLHSFSFGEVSVRAMQAQGQK